VFSGVPVGGGAAGHRLVVAWQDPEGGSDFIAYRVFDARGAGGALLTADRPLVPRHDFVPSVATAPDQQNFVIVWDDNDAAVEGHLFDAAGNALGSQFRVDTPPPGSPAEFKPGGDAEKIKIFHEASRPRWQTGERKSIIAIRSC
jgi:hypothetical protein